MEELEKKQAEFQSFCELIFACQKFNKEVPNNGEYFELDEMYLTLQGLKNDIANLIPKVQNDFFEGADEARDYEIDKENF